MDNFLLTKVKGYEEEEKLRLYVRLLYLYSLNYEISFDDERRLANWLRFTRTENSGKQIKTLHRWFFPEIAKEIALVTGQQPSLIVEIIAEEIDSIFLPNKKIEGKN